MAAAANARERGALPQGTRGLGVGDEEAPRDEEAHEAHAVAHAVAHGEVHEGVRDEEARNDGKAVAAGAEMSGCHDAAGTMAVDDHVSHLYEEMANEVYRADYQRVLCLHADIHIAY